MLEAAAQAWAAQEPSYHSDFQWVSLEQISPYAASAVIASEDQQFRVPRRLRLRFHPRSRARQRTWASLCAAPSTISQQVAKNLFPVARAQLRAQGPRGLLHRADRGAVAQERILEMYLNVAQFGNGIYGVQAAAQHFWHKPARRLSSSEAALLAAVLPNPLRLRVDRPSRLRAGAARLDSRPDARPGGPGYPARAGERAGHGAEGELRIGLSPAAPLQDHVTRHSPAVASGYGARTHRYAVARLCPRSSFRPPPGAWTVMCCAPSPRVPGST